MIFRRLCAISLFIVLNTLSLLVKSQNPTDFSLTIYASKKQNQKFHERPYKPPFNHDDLILITTPAKYHFHNYSGLSHWWQGHEDKQDGEWRMFFKDKFPQRGSVGDWKHDQWYDIFTEFDLYQYPQFRSMLQENEEKFYWYMISFANLLNSDKDFVHALQNMRVTDNKTLIQYIYEHAQNGKEYFAYKQQRKKVEQEHYKINERKKDYSIALQDLLQDIDIVEQCKSDFLEKTFQEDFSPQSQERFAQRARILENLISDNHSIEICNYQLTQDGKSAIQFLALNVSEWQQFYGNVMQQQFHAEAVEIANRLGSIKQLAEQQKIPSDFFVRLVGNYLEVAHEYNKKATRIDKAAAALDLCWGLLDCFYAVAQGVGDGVANIAHMVMHPIDTAISMAQGTFMIADALVRLEVLGDQYEFNEKLAEHNAAHYTGMIDAVVEVLKEQSKDLKPRDIIRGATALATDWYLFGKALLATEMLYKKAKDKAVHLAQKAGEILSKESVILKTAEGFDAKIGHDIAENLSKMATEHIASGSELIKKFNVVEYCHEIGDLAKLEEAIKLFGDMPSAMSKDGPLRKVLEYGKKGCTRGNLDTARGAMYELEIAVDLAKRGEDIFEIGKRIGFEKIKARDFDIVTRTKFIECKNINWNNLSVDRVEEMQQIFGNQLAIAKGLGKTFEVYSKTPISEFFKSWFTKKGIKFIQG